MTRNQPQKGSTVQDADEFALQVSLCWELRVYRLPVSNKGVIKQGRLATTTTQQRVESEA